MIQTTATCDKCKNYEIFQDGRTNSLVCDILCYRYGWQIVDEYNGELLCLHCRNDEEEEEDDEEKE